MNYGNYHTINLRQIFFFFFRRRGGKRGGEIGECLVCL